jgi:HEPN domain-containing protein
MALDPLLVGKLTIAREMLAKAAMFASESSSLGPAQGIAACQDAVELVLRGVVDFHNIEVPNRADFEDLIREIEKQASPPVKIPHHPRLTQINKARVAFKHLGIVPDAEQARQMVEFGAIAADEICKQCIGVSLWEATAIQLVRKTRVRSYLSKAIEQASTGRYTEACTAAGTAFALVFGEVERKTSSGFDVNRLRMPNLDLGGGLLSSGREVNVSQLGHAVKDDIKAIADELHLLGHHIAILRQGINADSLARFAHTVPTIRVFHGRVSVYSPHTFQPTESDATFAVQFALEAILRGQNDVLPYDVSRGTIKVIRDTPILAAFPSPASANIKFVNPPETIRIATAGETFPLSRWENLGEQVVEIAFEGDLCYVAAADVDISPPALPTR